MVVRFGSAWLPRLAFREIGPRRRFWLFGPLAKRLGCSIGLPIRLRHAVFLAPVWFRASMVCPARRGSDLRGASRGSPAAPCGLQNRVARTVQPAKSGLLDFGQVARRQAFGSGRFGE